jgi:pimeloyl-ACP methyl ester carboxylesterase
VGEAARAAALAGMDCDTFEDSATSALRWVRLWRGVSVVEVTVARLDKQAHRKEFLGRMKKLVARSFVGLSAVFLFFASRSLAANAEPVEKTGRTFVIVHGAWGGSWAFKEVERQLRERGHTVYRPALTGQGEKVHLARPDIDLTTHVTDVTNAILWEQLSDVVLVGHSYGGMVISGVLEKIPERIGRAIYLDAFVPNDGESASAALGSDRLPGELKDGFIVPAWVKANQPVPHDVPHPAKTLSEPLVVKNPAARKVATTYILTVDPGKEAEGDTFFRFAERAKERGWPVLTLSADHNPQWSKPAELVEMLDQAAAAR